MTNTEIRNKLISLSDEKYKKFQTGLCPGTKIEIMGVRIPKIRQFAKELVKDNPEEYLKAPEEKYMEELMLQGFVIANLK